jgi:hypothetical protein
VRADLVFVADVLQGEWQPIEEYSPDFTPSYTAPLAHRGPSAAQINVPAGGNYVREWAVLGQFCDWLLSEWQPLPGAFWPTLRPPALCWP